MRRWDGAASALALVALFLVGWEVGVRFSGAPVYILPAPSRVVWTLWSDPGTFAQAALVTLSEAAAGLLLGVTAAALLATLLVLAPGLENGVMALAVLVKSTPLVAIAPLLTIWLGFGALPKVIVTALMTFFPVLVNVLAGMQRPDPALEDLFRSWRADRWEVFVRLRAPSALPLLFAALKIAAPLALVGAVVAEWTGASGGLGRVMWLAYTNLNLPYLFGVVFLLAVGGMAAYAGLDALEKRILFWK